MGVKMVDSYDSGRQRGREAIGKTANEVVDEIKGSESLRSFMMYMWGLRDAYDEMLSSSMHDLIPIKIPENPEERRILWVIASGLSPMFEAASSDAVTATATLQRMATSSVEIVSALVKKYMLPEDARTVMHAMVDAIDMQASDKTGTK